MQTQWYGDNRDLVKWGTLVHLCQKHGLKTIVQVPFLLKEKGCLHKLSIDGNPVDFPSSAWKHFRDLKHIKNLGKQTGLTIEVFPHECSNETRDGYVRKILETLNQLCRKRKVVFLDPDTGIEPQKSTSKHVKVNEIKSIWRCLRPEDWLVLYQHASREKRWEEIRRKKFSKPSGVPIVSTYRSEIAPDVVFFASCKSLENP